MILPNDEDCQRIVAELEDDPGLTQWQSDFIDSNRNRKHFTDLQKEVLAELREQFEL
jgi:hypothetical protein